MRALVGLAGVVAGSGHAHLVEAWRADLFGDPDSDRALSVRRRLGLAGGDVAAAVRCRLDDLAALAWRHADKVLASWHGSQAAVVVPVVLAAVVIVSREGWYGLVTNAENLGCIAAGSVLAVKGLRAHRGISAPKRPEKKPVPAGHRPPPHSEF